MTDTLDIHYAPMDTYGDTRAAHSLANAILLACGPTGETPNPKACKDANELHTLATARAAELQAERVARIHGGTTEAERVARAERLSIAAERCETRRIQARRLQAVKRAPIACERVSRVGWTVNRETVTLTRHTRWNIRACVDIAARERVEAERLTEMMIAHTGTARADRIRARAMASGEIVGYAPTKDGAWDEWTPRGITNARETRAAERGRGIVKRGPSAAKVTTRDHYAPASSLRMLATVGVATHPDATGSDYARLLDTILRAPMLATYRAYAPGDTVGVVCDVHTPDAPEAVTHAHTAPTVDTRATLDMAIAASLATTDVGAMLDS